MSTRTKLGIITNYSEPETLNMDLALKDPREITLIKWFGITNEKQQMSLDKLKETALKKKIINKPEFLKNNFIENFRVFDKLHSSRNTSDSGIAPSSLNDTIFSDFSVKKLIIIYLEATQTDNNWNTDGSGNRIYLFDRDGKELKTPVDMTQVGPEAGLTKFFEIKIVENVLSILKDGKQVPFSVVDTAAMTLARLISSLLGTNIDYQGQNSTGPYQANLEQYNPVSQDDDDDDDDNDDDNDDDDSSRSSRAAPVQLGSAPVGNDEEVRPLNYGGKGKKSRKKQRNGGKKSRKQRKGGKKSRKQRKSMRKMKRSRSKK